MVAADGVSPGVLTLGAVQGSILQIDGTQTLHNTIKLENYSQMQTGADGRPATLTFASDTSVSGDGSVGGTGALVNHGAITADVAGQALELSGSGLTNSGSMAETNGATLGIDTGFTNTGTVTATAGTLRIADLLDNSAGTITATNAEIELGDLSTAKLGQFHRSGGRLLVTGTIDNTGQNLDLTRGRLARLTLSGTIRGGTLMGVSGLKLTYPYSALLDGVTLLGNLTVTGGGLRLADGAAVRTADGTAPGTITDNGQALILQGTQTFQGTINLADKAVLGAGAYAVGKPPGPGTDTLTLASASAISGAGTIRDSIFLGESGGQGIFIGPATILNAGSIAATVAGQSLSITPNTFTNTGSLSSILGATLTVAPAHFTNLAHGTLDGGEYFPGGALQLKSDGVLTTIGGTDRTDVQLDRQGQLSSWDAATSSYVAFGGTLTTIGAHGNLSLASNTTFAHALTNAGNLTQYDGEHTIKAPGVTNTSGGSVLLWGTLDAPLRNDGIVSATEGSRVTGAVTGSGELDLLTVTTLELSKVDLQTIKFIGPSSTLKLDAPGAYTGKITGFTSHETIDLAGLQADGTSYATGVLTLYDGESVVDRLNLPGTFSNEIFVVQPDGAGGTSLQVNDLPITSVPGAETVAAGSTTQFGGVSVADADGRFPDETFTLQVRDVMGLLNATANGGQAAITGAHTNHLTLTGGLFDVNTALNTLSYTAAGAGSDTIRTLTSDGRGGSDTQHFGVTITSHMG